MFELFGDGERKIYTVTELTREIRFLLERNFFYVSVLGEISNLRIRGGHLYFSLKDEESLIKVVMFGYRGKIPPGTELKEGLKVVCTGRLTVYDRRGEYQIIAGKVEIAGMGDLYLEIEKLKKKLEAEGLFRSELKKDLPLFPWRIGIVTSPSGAAIRDMLRILHEKGLGGEIFIYPSKVQGDLAHLELIEGVRFFNTRLPVDVIIIGRGGGSVEDLMPFNDENLAREIVRSRIPVISAVGHEIDFTISDFVADLRAPTPTAAGEIIAKMQMDFLLRFIDLIERMERKINEVLTDNVKRFQLLFTRLMSYTNRINMKMQYIDQLEIRLENAMNRYLDDRRRELAHLASSLNNLSPLKVLERGYSIAMRKRDGFVISSIRDVTKGESVSLKLKDGEVDCEVKEIRSN